MHAAIRFTQIPFTHFAFETTSSFIPSPSSLIKELQAPAEFDLKYCTPPFNGAFNSLFLTILKFHAVNFHGMLLIYIQVKCNATGQVGNSESFLHFPPSIYFAWQPNYPFHILRSDKEPGSHLWDLHQHYTHAVTLIHSLHALFTLKQSANCVDEDIEVMFTNGNLCTLVTLYQGEFYQQLAPLANPLYSLFDPGYICSVCGILHFYGKTNITQILDEILVILYPDEDLMATLLMHYHLDNLIGIYVVLNFSIHQIYNIAKNTHEKQCHFYDSTGVSALMAFLLIALSLLKDYAPLI